MPWPTFNVTKFEGAFIFVQINFPNISLLSMSSLSKVDSMTFKFNDSQIFVSTKFEIPNDLSWSFTNALPIMSMTLAQTGSLG